MRVPLSGRAAARAGSRFASVLDWPSGPLAAHAPSLAARGQITLPGRSDSSRALRIGSLRLRLASVTSSLSAMADIEKAGALGPAVEERADGGTCEQRHHALQAVLVDAALSLAAVVIARALAAQQLIIAAAICALDRTDRSLDYMTLWEGKELDCTGAEAWFAGSSVTLGAFVLVVLKLIGVRGPHLATRADPSARVDVWLVRLGNRSRGHLIDARVCHRQRQRSHPRPRAHVHVSAPLTQQYGAHIIIEGRLPASLPETLADHSTLAIRLIAGMGIVGCLVFIKQRRTEGAIRL